jgi:serine/threonine protein kinase/Leucine-rich repeat (LRR) protein
MRIEHCPRPEELELLFLGGLPEEEARAREEHVLACPSCLETFKTLVRTRDTLADLLAKSAHRDLGSAEPVVADLVQRLKTLHPARLGERSTHSQSSRLDATVAIEGPAGVHDPSLVAFLAAPQSDDELGRLGKYRILAVLGHGGMGVVYRAEDTLLKRLVALKAMLPGLAGTAGKRFLREAQAMAAVEHDYIVRIYDVGEERGIPFLAMEFLRGEPLDDRLDRDGRLPVAEVVRIGREIAEGLQAAHAKGLIHRDIKPGNVWLEARQGEPEAFSSATGVGVSATGGRIKILDFGLARAASQDAGLTQQGTVVGTPAYMAPEQARGETVDARCDLFSLGCVLYRLSTGKLPFDANDAASTLVAVLTTQPEAPLRLNSHLPPGFSALVMRLLEKDPARRFGSAGEVIQALRGLEQPQPPERSLSEETASREPPSGRQAPAARRLPWLIGVAVLLLGVAGMGLWASGLIRFSTEQGDLVLDCDDSSFAFVPVKGGGVTLEDRKNKRTYTVKAVPQGKDQFELEVTEPAAELTFKTRTLTVKRGERVALKAWFERKAAAVKVDPDEAWRKQVAALPPEKQVEAVVAKLKERNPNFDGKVTPRIEDGVVTELSFGGEHVRDLSPVRALTGLQFLNCPGRLNQDGLADLSPLQGLKLRSITIAYTRVSDLTPLKDMKLVDLNCGGTRVSDPAPLKGMPLRLLVCHDTKISDLSPVAGPHLRILNCVNTPVADLTPLKGTPLTTLHCSRTKVIDLAPLQTLPLKTIECDFQPARDAAILRSIKTLETINGKLAAEFWKKVADRAKPIEESWFKEVAALPAQKQVEAVAAKLKERNPRFKSPVTPTIEKGVVTGLVVHEQESTAVPSDLSPLRALTGLERLRCDDDYAKPSGVLTDLSPLRGLRLKELALRNTGVADLSPLQGMPLENLVLSRTRVADLSPLRGMPLKWLNCWLTPVADLSPLKGMPLMDLNVGANVHDLTPLQGLPLKSLALNGSKVTDLSPLKGMPLGDLNVGANVHDLKPLQGMPLRALTLTGSKVTDLSLLKGMPLRHIYGDFKPERDAAILRSIKTLEEINHKPADLFWKEVDRAEPERKP